MKNITNKILSVFVASVVLFGVNSCVSDLLEQVPTTELGASVFWKTEADATFALQGAYASIRPLFDRDYYLDGQGEFVRTRGTSTTSGNLRLGDAYNGGNYNPTGYGGSFDKMYRYLYGGVNRANYVIENVNRMLETASPESKENLEAIVGEARLLRGMVYFRLISMWGDVPYLYKVINDNSEVSSLSRTPIVQVKDSIMADFTYAFQKLPVKSTIAGRAGKPAALAFRGKLQLYWASWNKFGWPELDTFKPDAGAAATAYAAAAEDFGKVINDYGLNLYRNGEPGEIDSIGQADKLPTCLHLWQTEILKLSWASHMVEPVLVRAKS
mgnify:CR=1 FL=1